MRGGRGKRSQEKISISQISSPNHGNINCYWYRVEPFTNVINLSKYSFTKYQHKLLNKNLILRPILGIFNKNEVIND